MSIYLEVAMQIPSSSAHRALQLFNEAPVARVKFLSCQHLLCCPSSFSHAELFSPN
jgi:hypothetical protein